MDRRGECPQDLNLLDRRVTVGAHRLDPGVQERRTIPESQLLEPIEGAIVGSGASYSAKSVLDCVISGLISTIGSGLAAPSSRFEQSITSMRRLIPICGAASPRPGASYIVSSISWARTRISSSISVMGSQSLRKRGSGWIRIGRLIAGELGHHRVWVNQPWPRLRLAR